MPGVPAIVVKANSVGDAYRLRAELRRGGTTAVFPAEILLDLYSTLGDARDVLAIISVAAQALVIAAVLLAVFAVLAARRQQLAVLRALGASRSFVFAVVWCQVMIMIAAGALIGLGLGWFGAQAISRIVEARTGLAMAARIARPALGMVLALLLVGWPRYLGSSAIVDLSQRACAVRSNDLAPSGRRFIDLSSTPGLLARGREWGAR